MASKAFEGCCATISVVILLTMALAIAMAVFCDRKRQQEADCDELMDKLVNMTSEEAKSQCSLESQGGQLCAVEHYMYLFNIKYT